MGIPTVTVATRPFLHAARNAARARPLPGLPIVAIEHDYLYEDEAAIRDRVAGIVEPLLAGLLRGSD